MHIYIYIYIYLYIYIYIYIINKKYAFMYYILSLNCNIVDIESVMLSVIKSNFIYYSIYTLMLSNAK